MFSFTETKAAEYVASMVKRSEQTVQRQRSGVMEYFNRKLRMNKVVYSGRMKN